MNICAIPKVRTLQYIWVGGWVGGWVGRVAGRGVRMRSIRRFTPEARVPPPPKKRKQGVRKNFETREQREFPKGFVFGHGGDGGDGGAARTPGWR